MPVSVLGQRGTLRRPNRFLYPLLTAVKVIWPMVGGQRVLLPAEREFALGDAIADAAGDRAEIGMAVEVAFQVVEAEHDVIEVARLVGNMQLRDDPTISDDLHDHTIGVFQGVLRNGRT